MIRNGYSDTYGGGIRGTTDNTTPLSKARILCNKIIDCTAELGGGAIWGHGGLIAYNMIGEDGHPNQAPYGAALADCHGEYYGGAIQMNVIWYNGRDAGGDTTAASGGAIYECSAVYSNFIYNNAASYGGGLTRGGTTFALVGEDWAEALLGKVQGNIIAENEATLQGGGLYAGRGRIENNTIYGNRCLEQDGIGGIYQDTVTEEDRYPGEDFCVNGVCTDVEHWPVLQNNILWKNQSGAGPALVSNAVNDEFLLPEGLGFRACAVDVYAADADGVSTGLKSPWERNFGPFPNDVEVIDSEHEDQGVVVDDNGLKFLSTTWDDQNWNFETYLHLTPWEYDGDDVVQDSGSPCVDRAWPLWTEPVEPGSALLFKYYDEGQIDQHPQWRYYDKYEKYMMLTSPDFDDQHGQRDYVGVGNEYVPAPPNEDSPEIPKDIGADEAPTIVRDAGSGVDYYYWWQNMR